MSINIEKICRTCLALSGPLLSIYDDSSSGGCLADMLRDFTKTKPKREDKLPEMVCLNCISEINRCYSFKLKCENSNRTLLQLLPEAALEDTKDVDTKSAQTMGTNKTTVEVQTENIVKDEPIRCHQSVQTSVQLSDKSTSPTVAPMETEDRKRKRFRVEKYQDLESAKEKMIHEAHKRNDIYEIDEQNEDEIILELQEDSNNECFTTLNTIQLECENEDDEETAYYELSCPSYDYEDAQDEASQNEEKEQNKNTTNLVDLTDDHYTQTIFIEQATNAEESATLEQLPQDKYDFTIYKSENGGETEIVARSTRARATRASNSVVDTGMLRKSELKCSSCIMTFVSQKNLRRHMMKRHGITTLEKEDIQKTTPKSKEVKGKLMQQVSKEEQTPTTKADIIEAITPQSAGPASAKLSFFCDRCNAGFALRKSLTCHRNLNACTAVTYKCDECDRVFVSEKTLTDHKYTHVFKSECSECRKIFETKEDLSQHMIEEHNRNIRNQCNVCKKVFTMLSALKDHMRVHSGEKPFLCKLCGKAFSQNANLKQHVMRHSKEKRFKCEECASSYVTKAELYSHQRTHTGDHPFKCEYCEASFTTSSTLLKHKRKHTGERPYGCEFCPMRFTVLNVLKNHRRTHTGEKPYKCAYCNKGFAQKGDCLIHQRTHTGERNYVCHCNETFTHLGPLRTHMKKAHDKDKCKDSVKRQRTTAERKAGIGADKVQHFTILDKEEVEECDESTEIMEKMQERQISDSGTEEVVMQIELEDI